MSETYTQKICEEDEKVFKEIMDLIKRKIKVKVIDSQDGSNPIMPSGFSFIDDLSNTLIEEDACIKCYFTVKQVQHIDNVKVGDTLLLRMRNNGLCNDVRVIPEVNEIPKSFRFWNFGLRFTDLKEKGTIRLVIGELQFIDCSFCTDKEVDLSLNMSREPVEIVKWEQETNPVGVNTHVRRR